VEVKNPVPTRYHFLEVDHASELLADDLGLNRESLTTPALAGYLEARVRLADAMRRLQGAIGGEYGNARNLKRKRLISYFHDGGRFADVEEDLEMSYGEIIAVMTNGRIANLAYWDRDTFARFEDVIDAGEHTVTEVQRMFETTRDLVEGIARILRAEPKFAKHVRKVLA
jgi:hypothetical protein